MERISIKLEIHDAAVSQKWIEDNVDGKGEYLRKALDVLADEGYITRQKDGKGYRIEPVRPYREADDKTTGDDDPETTSSRPRPDDSTSSRPRPETHLNPTQSRINERFDLVPNLVPVLVPGHP
jgi:hypothetical protein